MPLPILASILSFKKPDNLPTGSFHETFRLLLHIFDFIFHNNIQLWRIVSSTVHITEIYQSNDMWVCVCVKEENKAKIKLIMRNKSKLIFVTVTYS